MADQEKVATCNGPVRSPSKAVVRNMSDVAHDVINLVELQSKLFLVDARECLARLVAPGITLIVSVGMAASAIPVALVAGGYFLAESTELPLSASLLISAAAGAVIGGVLGVLGWYWFRKQFQVLGRSHAELTKNIQWIKMALKRNSRHARNVEQKNLW